MKQAVIVDLRNIYRPEEMNGFSYHSVGRRNGSRANNSANYQVRAMRLGPSFDERFR